jgi:ADP-ribose pyrophosphatase YjhB (NUDIX family)
MAPGVVSAVGVWFYAIDTARYLYLMRCDTKNPNCWGLPGGKLADSESLLDAINRECQEELGMLPKFERLVPIEKFTNHDDTFEYHTFFGAVAKEFQPKLNAEHRGYAWIDSGTWPRPMHPGLWNTVNLEDVMRKISLVVDQL